MQTLREWLRRLLGAFGAGRQDHDLEEELRSHSEFAAEDAARLGDAAARRTRVQLGGRAQVMEALRDQRGLSWLRDLAQDVRYAARLFGKRPGLATLSIAGLALGIGISTGVFALVNALAFKGDGTRDPASVFRPVQKDEEEFPWTASDFRRLQASLVGIDVAAQFWGTGGGHLRQQSSTDADDLPSVSLGYVSGNFFSVVRANASAGRLLSTGDDQPGAPAVLVLSHDFWTSQCNADPTIVGRAVWIDDRPATVVGVAESGFTGGRGAAVMPVSGWMTLEAEAQQAREEQANSVRAARAEQSELARKSALTAADRARLETLAAEIAHPRPPNDYVSVRIRVTPAVSRTQVEDRVATVAGAIAAERGNRLDAVHLSAVNALSAPMREMIAILLVLTGIPLLIAGVNVANLLLASVIVRGREIGARLALGATAFRLSRQLLAESLLLTLVAGAAGWFVALWLAPLFATTFGMRPTTDTSPDGRVLLFALLVTSIAGVAAGVVPIRRIRNTDPIAFASEHQSATRRPRRQRRMQSLLVCVQAAGSIVLLALTALLTRAVWRATTLDLGVDVAHLINVTLQFDRTATPSDRSERMAAATDRIRELPGVAGVSRVTFAPFSRGGAMDAAPKGSPIRSYFRNFTSADYFQTVGLKVLRGRTYSPEEARLAAPVAVISDRLARAFWGAEDPIGSSLQRLWGPDNPPGGTPDDWIRKPPGTRVIGVVADAVAQINSYDYDRPTLYLPIALQVENPDALVVRVDASMDPAELARPIREALRAIDPRTSSTVALPRDLLEDGLSFPRKEALLAGFLSASALALAALGLFGVTAFGAAQREHEIGVHLALGAERASVILLIARESLIPVAIGLVAGMVLALWGGKLVHAATYGVSARDPLAMSVAALALIVAALGATVGPARRAAQADPARVLRAE